MPSIRTATLSALPSLPRSKCRAPHERPQYQSCTAALDDQVNVGNGPFASVEAPPVKVWTGHSFPVHAECREWLLSPILTNVLNFGRFYTFEPVGPDSRSHLSRSLLSLSGPFRGSLCASLARSGSPRPGPTPLPAARPSGAHPRHIRHYLHPLGPQVRHPSCKALRFLCKRPVLRIV